MTQTPQPRVASWASWATLIALGFVLGCGGSNADAPPIPPYPGHLAFVGADAEVVISVNNLTERSKAIVESNAYTRFQEFINKTLGTDPEMKSLVSKPKEALSRFEDLFSGRLTFVSYPAATDEGDNPFVLLVDGDARALVQALEQLDLPEGQATLGEFTELDNGVARYQPPAGEEGDDPLFVSQRGHVGMVGSDPAILTQVASVVGGPPKGLLAEQPAFASMTKKLRQDADVFIWIRDWTSEQEGGWDALLANTPPGGRVEKGAAATLMLKEGVDAELIMEFRESDFEDPDSRAVFSAMRNTGQSQKIAPMLPSGTLAYLGMNMNLLELVQSMDMSGDMGQFQSEQFNKMLEEFVGAFNGEFAVAITSAPTDGAPSLMLGYPVPGAVFIARLTDPGKQPTVRTMMDAYLESQSVSSGGKFLVQRSVDTSQGAEMVLYTTMDPNIEVGYTFHDGCLLLGTRAGLLDVLTAKEKNGVDAMASRAGSDTIKDSLSTPSHFALFLDLTSLYQFVRANHGDSLGPFSDMVAGPPEDDPLMAFFNVFRHAGGNLSFQKEQIYLRLYITATDLP